MPESTSTTALGPMVSYFTTLARYNLWATERLLRSVAALDEAQYRADCGLFFRSVHGTLNHLLVAEHGLWRVRFAQGTSPKVALDAELIGDRAALAEALVQGAAAWLPLVAGWNGQRFAGTLAYRNMRGQDVELPFAATLGHVFNHGTHHRGQITAALGAMGQPCPELDMVYMLQEDGQKTGAVA